MDVYFIQSRSFLMSLPPSPSSDHPVLVEEKKDIMNLSQLIDEVEHIEHESPHRPDEIVLATQQGRMVIPARINEPLIPAENDEFYLSAVKAFRNRMLIQRPFPLTQNGATKCQTAMLSIGTKLIKEWKTLYDTMEKIRSLMVDYKMHQDYSEILQRKLDERGTQREQYQEQKVQLMAQMEELNRQHREQERQAKEIVHHG